MSHLRRRELLRLAVGVALLPVARFTQAEQRVVTPEQMQGPFYPLEFPLDKDSDLTTFAGRDRKSTRLNSSHLRLSRMPSSA